MLNTRPTPTARGQSVLATLALLALLGTPVALAAQRWQVDATGTRIAFDTTGTLNSASLAPSVEWHSSEAFANLSGSLTGFEDSQWAVQGRGDLSLLFNPFGPRSRVRMETAGVAAGTSHSSNFRTATTRGELRIHVAGRQVGSWAGVVGATGWTSGSEIATAVGPTAGVWGRTGTTRAALIFTPLRIEGFWFSELNGRASATVGLLDVAAYGGWRSGATGSAIEATGWGGGMVSLWLTPTLAVVAAGGSYPQDLLQALPTGRYASVGVRLASWRPTVPSVEPIGRRVYEREDGTVRLRFRVDGASRVEFVSDRTQWQAVPMERASDGSWVLRIRIPPGVHRFNLIVDGTEWIVPDGVPPADDGYGGRTGLLIVP